MAGVVRRVGSDSGTATGDAALVSRATGGVRAGPAAADDEAAGAPGKSSGLNPQIRLPSRCMTWWVKSGENPAPRNSALIRSM
jgi:hypothetical protein